MMSKPQAQPQPTPVIYDNDTRYPGPLVHPPPAEITGMPTQSELDAQARMFTWGELKEIVRESRRCSSGPSDVANVIQILETWSC